MACKYFINENNFQMQKNMHIKNQIVQMIHFYLIKILNNVARHWIIENFNIKSNFINKVSISTDIYAQKCRMLF